MTQIYVDTEFLEDGRTIDLISIALVSETGAEYYAVPSNLPDARIARHRWLMANVVPGLPLIHGDQINRVNPRKNPLRIDWNHPDIKPTRQIAEEVREFITGFPKPELWAWYAAYDHVALAQLWGTMIELPSGVPMWTNDIKQEAHRLGFTDDELPRQDAGLHNALADARHNMRMHEWLIAREQERTP